MTNYLISKYEEDLAQRNAAEGLQDEDEEDGAGDIGTPEPVAQTEFKETDEVPAPEKK